MIDTQASFADFGGEFQEKIIQALLVDKQWAEQMVEIVRPEYFDLGYLQYIASRYFDYYNKYKTFPTLGILRTVIKRALKETGDKSMLKDIKKFFLRMKNDPELCDMPYVQEESLAFCKKQAMVEALDKSVDLIESDKYEEVLPIMKQALIAGQESSLGHDFERDREARWEKEYRRPVPTGLIQLDAKVVFDGGVGRGELAVLAASKGVGKSHWLVQIGGVALELGLNVIHYSFELRDIPVGLRYDSWLCNIDSKEISERKADVLAKYEEIAADPQKELGRLIIKKYPIGSATCNTIRAHLQRLLLKENFKPDIIIVDYADNMRATEKFETDQTRFELKRIYEELRNIAEEYDVPCWTASQINKEGSRDDIATIEHLAEAFGKADVADIIITIACDQKKKANGYAKMFIAKSRAGVDGLRFSVYIDRRTSRFKIVSDDEVPDDQDDEEEQKKKARRASRRLEKKRLDSMGTERPEKIVH